MYFKDMNSDWRTWGMLITVFSLPRIENSKELLSPYFFNLSHTLMVDAKFWLQGIDLINFWSNLKTRFHCTFSYALWKNYINLISHIFHMIHMVNVTIQVRWWSILYYLDANNLKQINLSCKVGIWLVFSISSTPVL